MQTTTTFVPVQKVPNFILDDAMKMSNGMNVLASSQGECHKLNNIARNSMIESYAGVLELMTGCSNEVAKRAVSREYCFGECLGMFPISGTSDPDWPRFRAYWIQNVQNATDYLNTLESIKNGTYSLDQHKSSDSSSEILKICHSFLTSDL